MSRPRLSRIGRLNRRLSLERPEDVPDGSGGVKRTWSDVAQVWAAIAALAGSETVVADQGRQRLTHRITIRWRGDLTAEMRFRSASRTFSITTVVDPDDRRHFLECLTLEETP